MAERNDSPSSALVRFWPLIAAAVTFGGSLYAATHVTDYRVNAVETRQDKMEQSLQTLLLRSERQSQMLEDIRTVLKDGHGQ